MRNITWNQNAFQLDHAGVAVYWGQWSHKPQAASCKGFRQEYDPQLGKVLLNNSTNVLSFAAYCTTTLFINAHSYRPHHSNKYLQLFCVSAYTASLGAQKAHLCCFSLKQDKLLNLSLQFQASHQPGTFPTITFGYLIAILSLIQQHFVCV